jgi:hypothetical protein
LGCLGGKFFGCFSPVANGLSIHKAPDVNVEGSEFFPDGQEGFCVLNCGGNFQPVLFFDIKKQPGKTAVGKLIAYDIVVKIFIMIPPFPSGNQLPVNICV